ncbi:hypothetical protein BC828DRAFT_430443 [Blastocladiella britannica]|nr:hypothetical protein BC828DRAFT_430443 [Blastocladiella britannica]
MFSDIVDYVVEYMTHHVVEWWWQKFLRHGTPDHSFGKRELVYAAIQNQKGGLISWFWDLSHSHPNFPQLDWKEPPSSAFPNSFLSDVVESSDIAGLDYLITNQFDCCWDMAGNHNAFANQDFALLKWRHARKDELKGEHYGGNIHPWDLISSGPISAELLEMYQWWKNQYGFVLKEIGSHISKHNYLPALWWWLAELDAHP